MFFFIYFNYFVGNYCLFYFVVFDKVFRVFRMLIDYYVLYKRIMCNFCFKVIELSMVVYMMVY